MAVHLPLSRRDAQIEMKGLPSATVSQADMGRPTIADTAGTCSAANDTCATNRPRTCRNLKMDDKEYEYVTEQQDDEDDEDSNSQTAYNPYYYEMKDEELIRESNDEIEGKKRREQE